MSDKDRAEIELVILETLQKVLGNSKGSGSSAIKADSNAFKLLANLKNASDIQLKNLRKEHGFEEPTAFVSRSYRDKEEEAKGGVNAAKGKTLLKTPKKKVS